MENEKNTFSSKAVLSADLPASLVVFLVALPLCLGIALASGAPLFSGIIAGIVGGIIVGALSGSSLSVSGPAAGLTIIVLSAIQNLPTYEAFLLCVVVAGFFQIIFGKLKAGIIGDFVPSSVIKGMLAAIGLLLIFKQIPHLFGYDADFEGDQEFFQADGHNTFSEIFYAIKNPNLIALSIGALAILIQILWEQPIIKKIKAFRFIPAPLIVVAIGIGLNTYLSLARPDLALGGSLLVSIPVSISLKEFGSFFTFPDFSAITNFGMWKAAITIAIVASLESLLSLEASDKLDPLKRVSPPNQELVAQGVGNIISGLIGGLPVTAVIVRSSANIQADAKSKFSAIFHGILLLISIYFVPDLLNKIPLSSLAGILLFVGYKLAKPSVFKSLYIKGNDQIIPFVITIVAILFSDLLIGICIGVLSSIFFILKSNFRLGILEVKDEDRYLIRLNREVSFLNKHYIRQQLELLPENAKVLIDASKSDYIDKDVIEIINDFLCHAHLKNISIEFKTDLRKNDVEFNFPPSPIN